MTVQDSPSRHLPKMMVRLPYGMRHAIKERARKAGRSMNAEMVQILSAALNHEIQGDTTVTGRKSNEQFMLRLPDGMRDRISDAAEGNGRSMTQEIVLALQAHLDGPGGSRNDHRMMLAGQALNGILAGPHGADVRPQKLTDAAARNIAHTALFLADMVLRAAQPFDNAGPADEAEFVT